MAYNGGGGILAYGNVTVEISGSTEIYENKSFAGAGIHMLPNGSAVPKLTMTGGYVYGNEAMYAGGAGIVYYAAGTENTISGAKIGIKPDGTAAPNVAHRYKVENSAYVKRNMVICANYFHICTISTPLK